MWELEWLKKEFLYIKKESFEANKELKEEIKRLWFYNWDESWENINFNISSIRQYLESIRNKTWSELNVRASELEKWVRTIAIQIAINYINLINWGATNNIDLIDGVRGNETWKWVKEFQTTYKLRNKDGLPWRETINKILELLWSNVANDQPYSTVNTWINEESEIPEEFFMTRLNQKDIDDRECINLLSNIQIQTKDINPRRNFQIQNMNNGYDVQNWSREDFIDKLNVKVEDKSGLEWIVFNNPGIQNLLVNIIDNQWHDIIAKKRRYQRRKQAEGTDIIQSIRNEKLDELQPAQSLEDYRYNNSSVESFEEFVLSDAWRAIIMNEIKSHIDTSHKNADGEYDKFYGTYPVSASNLEIELKNAWNIKSQMDYYKRTGYYDEKKEKFGIIAYQINWSIIGIVADYMKSGKQDFNQNMRLNLESLLSERINWATINEILSKDDDKDLFKVILGNIIEEYETYVRNKNNINLNTKDKQISLQLKSYLYIYGSIFYPDYFKSGENSAYYEEILPEIMLAILSNSDVSLIDKIKHKELLALEKKLEKERRERDRLWRIELAKKYREANERSKSNKTGNDIDVDEVHTRSMDPNNATWPEIAAEAGLWKELDDYNLDIEETEEWEKWKKETAFRDAWKEFIQINDNLKSIITQDQMHKLFDADNNIIDNSEWEIFKRFNPLLKDKSPEEIKKIYNTLSSFPSYFGKANDELSNNSDETKTKVNETVKTYAIWAVIDNVRDTFNVINEWNEIWELEWFKLNIEDPVRKEWDDIIISGSFNGSEVKVRYNLKTGELFMNSFFHRLSPSKITIGMNSSIDYPIWNINPFNGVLNDYYKFSPNLPEYDEVPNWPQPWKMPWQGPMMNRRYRNNSRKNGLPPSNTPQTMWALDWFAMPRTDENTDPKTDNAEILVTSQLDLIGEAIKNSTKSQAQENTAITGFMKTFNIMPDSWDFSSLDFDEKSNLFDVIEIIHNTANMDDGDIQSLEYFNNTFMPTIMKYSWLEWGYNNLYGPKRKENNKNNYDVTFNENNDNKYLLLIRETVRDFSLKLRDFRYDEWTRNYNSDYQLWFADFIKNNFVKRDKPNWILNTSLMETFVNNLQKQSKEKDNLETQDKEDDNISKKLDERLDNNI